MTYFDDLKYNEFAKDTDSYFENVKLINFDIIHHECRGDKLQNPERYYRTTRNKDFKNYEQRVQNNVISPAIKFERDDIHFEHVVLKQHFNEKTAVENALISNGFFVKKTQLILPNWFSLKKWRIQIMFVGILNLCEKIAIWI